MKNLLTSIVHYSLKFKINTYRHPPNKITTHIYLDLWKKIKEENSEVLCADSAETWNEENRQEAFEMWI